MEKSKKRFVSKQSEGLFICTEVLVDTETGVNYLYHGGLFSSALTPLLDSQGNIVVTKED